MPRRTSCAACRLLHTQGPRPLAIKLEVNYARRDVSAVGRTRNLLLASMPEEQYERMCRFLVPTDLPLGMRFGEPNAPVEYVYFPVSGMISVDALTEAGESVEVGVTGREGCSGVFGLLGHQQGSHTVVMQGPGTGLRARTGIVREEFLRGGPFMQAVHSFLYMQLVQMSQSVLCNRLHPVDMRMARWILTASDRTQSDTLQITQEFLAQMLGSRRSTVTVAAGQLQREGLIDYSRGRVKIADRMRMEARACECYGIVRGTYDRLIGQDF